MTASTVVHINNLTADEKGKPVIKFEIEYLCTSSLSKVSTLTAGRNYVPKAKDKIFIMSGCNIPRFKVKQFCLKYDVALVKFEDRAMAKFIGPDVINELTTHRSSYFVSKAYMLNYLRLILGDGDPTYQPLFDAINASTSDTVKFDYNFQYNTREKKIVGLKLFKDDTIEKKECKYTGYECFSSEDAYIKYNALQGDPTVFDQDDILKVLNTGTVLTDEMYESVKRLFESTDKTNITLAMETLANCDYQTSAVPILLLLKEFGSKMIGVTGSQHVNFKSMLKYFNIERFDNMTLDTVINSLRHQKLLTSENLSRIMPLAKTQLDKDLHLDSFSISQIKLNPKLEAELIPAPVGSGTVEIMGEDEEELNMNVT
jgi:hypothetical protein